MLMLLLSAACGGDDPAAREPLPDCADDGTLLGEIHGSLRVSLDWRAGQLECSGMPRPHGAGARLRFAGAAMTDDGQRQFAIILGIPDLRRGETASELPTNVTVIEENAGRFFSTADTSACWTDIHRQEPAGAPARQDFLISGALYCVAPLAEVQGSASLNVASLNFVGQLDWRAPP